MLDFERFHLRVESKTPSPMLLYKDDRKIELS